MMDTSKHYKRFLQQKGVLDSMRAYLDLSDSFLDQLVAGRILSQGEVAGIKGMRWPTNRNELLQLLIRRPWNPSTFRAFCEALRNTQNHQLNTLVTDKAKDIMEGGNDTAVVESEDSPDIIPIDLTVPLDEKLGGDLNTQNKLRILLKENEDQIRELMKQNQDLKNQVRALAEENHQLSYQYQSLEKAADDTLEELRTDCDYESVLEGMPILRKAVVEMQIQIDTLTVEKSAVLASEIQLRDTIRMMNEEMVNMKRAKAKMQTKLEGSRLLLEDRVRVLEQALHEEQNKRFSVERLKKTGDAFKKQNIDQLSAELHDCKLTLDKTTRQLNEAVLHKDKAKEELADVQHRTRKLLSSLGLDNDLTNLGMSVEHARNLSYVRRRQSTHWTTSRSGSTDTHNSSHRLSLDSLPSMKAGQSILGGLRNGSLSSIGSSDLCTNLNLDNILETTIQDNDRQSLSVINDSLSAERQPPKCQTCGKTFDESSNFEGACIHHVENAEKLYAGTEVEVWSCCKSQETYKGCIKSRHVSE